MVSGGGNPEGSGYKHVKYEKGHNMKPCVPFVCKHIGTVITFLTASCTDGCPSAHSWRLYFQKRNIKPLNTKR
jgi:hypothetical protein